MAEDKSCLTSAPAVITVQSEEHLVFAFFKMYLILLHCAAQSVCS